VLSSESEPVTSHQVRWYARPPRDFENDFHTASFPNIRGVWTPGEATFDGKSYPVSSWINTAIGQRFAKQYRQPTSRAAARRASVRSDPLRQSFLSSARARVRLKYFAPSLEHSLTRLQAQAENRRSIDVRKADFPVIRVVDIDHYQMAGGWRHDYWV
jgi:hypothetical protein